MQGVTIRGSIQSITASGPDLASFGEAQARDIGVDTQRPEIMVTLVALGGRGRDWVGLSHMSA